ncbi:MAG: shikimate dehydrogenase [Cyanobacteria bacterium J06632_3]
MVIKGTTQLLGVIGYPVEHSFSPLMHNAAIAHLQQQSSSLSKATDYVYLPFPIRPDQLEAAVTGFKAIGLRGFNITIPHKQAIIPLLDHVSDVAKAIGAVNTVWRDDSGWHGTNTDAVGFLAPLKNLAKDWHNTRVVILGNGGAARAVVAACHQLGCKRIGVVGRSPEKLARFAESWASTPEIAARLKVMTWDELTTQLPKAGLVVNATPIGMHPEVAKSPLSENEMALLRADAIAYDLIYTPRPTQFLKQAIDIGLTAIDGLEMLVQQGAAALEIWLAQPAPVAVMRQSLLTYLGQEGG